MCSCLNEDEIILVTQRNRILKIHKIVHFIRNKMKKYKCESCSYKTIYNKNVFHKERSQKKQQIASASVKRENYFGFKLFLFNASFLIKDNEMSFYSLPHIQVCEYSPNELSN